MKSSATIRSVALTGWLGVAFWTSASFITFPQAGGRP
jgi:hypothetical protein